MELATLLKNVHLEAEFNQELVRQDMECVAHVSTFTTLHKNTFFIVFLTLSVQKSCGDTSSENCTYFQSSGSEVGQCRLKICPCNDNICQLRLDFQNFVINQPKTTATSVSHVAHVAAKILYDKLQCQTDIFSVTAPGNNAPPVICGSNSGEHSKSSFLNKPEQN